MILWIIVILKLALKSILEEVLLGWMLGRGLVQQQRKGDLKRDIHVRLFQNLCPPSFLGILFLMAFLAISKFARFESLLTIVAGPAVLALIYLTHGDG